MNKKFILVKEHFLVVRVMLSVSTRGNSSLVSEVHRASGTKIQVVINMLIPVHNGRCWPKSWPLCTGQILCVEHNTMLNKCVVYVCTFLNLGIL